MIPSLEQAAANEGIMSHVASGRCGDGSSISDEQPVW